MATWEAAYRAGAWKAWVFPAPSHVLDSTLDMINVRTGFGERLSAEWPRATDSGPARPPGPWYTGLLFQALGVSAVRLAVGFAVSIVIGSLLGMLMWRWPEVDRFFGPLFLGLQTLPSVCWVPLAVLTLGRLAPVVTELT